MRVHRDWSSGHAAPQLRAFASGSNDDRFQPARTDEEWLKLDEKVNKYPCHRTFKAIGVGGKVGVLHERLEDS